MDALQTSNRNGFLTTNLNILMMLLYNQRIHITTLILKIQMSACTREKRFDIVSRSIGNYSYTVSSAEL